MKEKENDTNNLFIKYNFGNNCAMNIILLSIGDE